MNAAEMGNLAITNKIEFRKAYSKLVERRKTKASGGGATE